MNTIQTIITVITALGGTELIKYLINLKANRAKANAQAEKARTNVLDDYVQGWKMLCDKQGEELDKSYQTTDKLRNIVDDARVREHDQLQKITDLSLDLKESEFDKCILHNCIDREPPREIKTIITKQ